MNTPDLDIPHPYLHLRRFTLAPLAEIAPALIHPVSGKTIAELLSVCPDELEVRKTEHRL
jgi:2-amino-4-hydroxy-6-hydroxymethyldihydropteridine diphosphokinase